MMAEVAAQWADVSILTAEDPRTESLEGILGRDGGWGAAGWGGWSKKSFWRVADRGESHSIWRSPGATGPMPW